MLKISFNREDMKNSISEQLKEDRIQTRPQIPRELWLCVDADIGTSTKNRFEDVVDS